MAAPLRLVAPAPWTCEDTEEALNRYLASETDERETGLVEAHLDTCRRCLEHAAVHTLLVVSRRSSRRPVH